MRLPELALQRAVPQRKTPVLRVRVPSRQPGPPQSQSHRELGPVPLQLLVREIQTRSHRRLGLARLPLPVPGLQTKNRPLMLY